MTQHRLPRRLWPSSWPAPLLGGGVLGRRRWRRRRRRRPPRRRPATEGLTDEAAARGRHHLRRPRLRRLHRRDHRGRGAAGDAIDAFVADPDRRHPRRRQAGLARRPRACTAPPRPSASTTARSTTPTTGPRARSTPGRSTRPTSTTSRATPTAGIINDTAGVPEITTDVLVAANEEGGETNISTGWHAIEFLLWGQDLSDDGPGARPVTDYTTSPTAERRATYLHAARRPARRRPRPACATSGTPRAAPTARSSSPIPSQAVAEHLPQHGRPVRGRAGRRAHRRRLRHQGPGGRALLLLRQHHDRHRRQRHRHAHGLHGRLPRRRRHRRCPRWWPRSSPSSTPRCAPSSTTTSPRPRPSRRRSTSSSSATTTRPGRVALLALITGPPGPGRHRRRAGRRPRLLDQPGDLTAAHAAAVRSCS